MTNQQRLTAERCVNRAVELVQRSEHPHHSGTPYGDGLLAAAGQYAAVASALVAVYGP